MTNAQENQYTMMITVKDYAKGYTSITTNLPEFNNVYGLFIGYLDQVKAARSVQEGDVTGVAVSKKNLRAELEDMSLKYSKKLVAYAKITKNSVLETKLYFTKTDLSTAADTILKDKAQLLYDQAELIIASLKDYLINEISQAAFKALIDAYEIAIPQPALAHDGRQTATDTIANSMDAALKELDILDSLVHIVEETEPTFYSGWFKAREIPKTGKGALAFRIKVTDVNNKLLPNVAISIIPDDTNAKKMEKISSVNGGNQVKNMISGKYSAVLTKAGYKDQTVKFAITAGELTDLVVVMEEV